MTIKIKESEKVEITNNSLWMDVYGKDYVGKWVAVSNGVLIKASDTLTALGKVPKNACIFKITEREYFFGRK